MQIVAAMIGFYASIFGVVKIKSAFSKKPEPPKPAPVAAAATSAVGSKWGFETPTLDTFDEWSNNAANWEKWEAFMSNTTLLEQWCAEIE